MPNVKIYIDETIYPAARAGLAALLPDLRAMLCEALTVDLAACQFALIPVAGMGDQPGVNAELAILPHPDRTRAKILAVAERVRGMLAPVTGQRVAVRIATLDAATYVALK